MYDNDSFSGSTGEMTDSSYHEQPQADINIIGFERGVDASRFGGELRQELEKVELPAGNNFAENVETIRSLKRKAEEELNTLKKKVRTTAFECGAIPPTKEGGGIVTQGLLSVTMNSSSSSMDTQPIHPLSPSISTISPQTSFEGVGKGSTLNNSSVTITQANTIINNNQYMQPSFVTPQAPLPETWHLPPGTRNFVGREDLLAEMEKCFTLPQSISSLVLTACHGLGGVGKTQLSLRYAWENYKKYKGVCFFSAENKEKLIQDYIDLGNELSLFDETQQGLLPEKRAAFIKGWFEHPARAGWLLIYDSASNHRDVVDLLPAKGGGILITSRHTEWPGEKISVDVFTLKEAREYIKKITGIINEPESGDELIKILGRLPLALAQVCAYIKRNKKNIKEYLVLYQKSRAALLEKNLLPEEDKHESVAVTWNITLDAMKTEGKESVELMYLCSQFHNENIPLDILTKFFTEEMQADDAKRIAEEYSMLKINQVNKIFSLHSLVQEVIKLQLKAENKFLTYFRKSAQALFKLYPGIDDRTEALQQKRNLLPHLSALLNTIDENTSVLNEEDKKHLELILDYLSNAYADLGDARKQKELLERALPIDEKHYGKDHVEVANTLGSLGNAYGALGDAQKKKEFLERALTIREKHYGKDHVEVAITLGSLGSAYGALGDAQKQKEFLERALPIQEKYYGKDHVRVANTLGSLGSAYGALGDVQKQKEFLERALTIQEKHYGKDHYQVAITLNNLGIAYGALGDAQKKKALLERTLAIEEEYYGKDHVEVAITLNNLGNAYGALGDVKKKKALLEQVLPIKEKYYGKDHVEVAITLNDLGNAYGVLGDAQKKKEFLERALPIFEKHYGKDHYEVAITLGDLGNVYCALSDAQKSKELLERALTIKEKHYGKNHYSYAVTQRGVGITYYVLEDIGNSKSILKEALSIFEKNYGKDNYHIHTCITLIILGHITHHQASIEKALIFEKMYYANNDYKVEFIQTSLGWLCNILGNQHKKREVLESCLPLYQKHYGEHHEYTEVISMALKEIVFNRHDSYFPTSTHLAYLPKSGSPLHSSTDLQGEKKEVETDSRNKGFQSGNSSLSNHQ